MFSSFKPDHSLAEDLPYWEVLSEPIPHVVLTDGALASGLKSTLLDTECFDEKKIYEITTKLRSLVNSLPEEMTVQFHYSVNSDFSDTIENHLDGDIENPTLRRIKKCRGDQLQESLDQKGLYHPSLCIFLKIPFKNVPKRSLFRKGSAFLNLSEEAYQENLDQLSQNLEMFVSSLNRIGFLASKLSKQEMIAQAYQFLNPKRSQSIPEPSLTEKSSMDASAREQMVFGDLVLDGEAFKLDSHFYKIITLKNLPEYTIAGQMREFLKLPFHYELLLTVHVPSQLKEMERLQQKRKVAHSLASTPLGKMSDLESESKLHSTEELMRELLETGQRIYDVQLMIVLRVEASLEGKKVLQYQVREVLSRFQSLQGAEGLEETVGAWKVLKTNLPLAPLALERSRKMKTDNLVDFLPMYGPRTGDEKPVVLFKNRMNGLVKYNPFDSTLPNFNVLVTGSSGAGKSFLNNYLLFQELSQPKNPMRVFILDIGGSYRKITQVLNGEYLELSLDQGYRLNPFFLEDSSKGPSPQKVKSLLAILEAMVSEENGFKISKLERALLEKAILEVYHECSPRSPQLKDLRDYLAKQPEPSLQAISKMLYLWTEDRAYGKVLDCPDFFKTNAQVCTFDLKGLSSHPDLQKVMILILTDFILGQIEQDKNNQKRIILDEAWSLLKSEPAAQFMEYCVRTLRKSGAGITFITQGIEEISQSSIGSAILNNTATKFILLQRSDTDFLKKTLKLNNREVSLIHTLEQKKGQYAEAFLIENDEKQIVRISPTPLEYWLSTSDARDNVYLEALIQHRGLPLEKAIESAVDDYPDGMNGKEVMLNAS